MQETVITFVAARTGALDTSFEHDMAQRVKSVGGGGVRIDALHPGKAVDMILEAHSPALTRMLYLRLAGLDGVDVFVQPYTLHRRAKLLVADMDGTIVTQETLDEVAARLGIAAKVAPVTAAGMAGEIDFAEALQRRMALLAGAPASVFYEVMEDMRPSPGAAALVRTMAAHGARAVLVSGGFDLFTAHMARTLGFHKHVGNKLDMDKGAVTGRIIPPLVDAAMKGRVLEGEMRDMQLTPGQVVAVGDGANDIPMLQLAGAGVGYHAKPAVRQAVPMQVRHGDLTALLYLQGYRQSEIVYS